MASYLLGDSITQFSLVIGVYLSAMGLGSYLSKFVDARLHDRFVTVQLIIAVVGGLSAIALFYGFAHLDSIRPLLFLILVIIGTGVGLEIPLLMRVMKEGQSLKDLVARVLAFDYVGSLVASILFPLFLLPYLGLVRTALLFGSFNALVALWSTRVFAHSLKHPRRSQIVAGLIAAGLLSGFFLGKKIETYGERQLFDAPVILSHKTPYQRLTVTRWKEDIRLFINGNLQFSSTDEHRYHEALVHPVMAHADGHARVAVLGGGDGLALREILEYESVEHVDLVDLDPKMVELFSTHDALVPLNAASFDDPRVSVHNDDAMRWVEGEAKADHEFDVIIIDLPDPNNYSLGKLYSRSFYRLVGSVLAEGGAIVVQSTSPYFSPRSYWCIVETLRSAEMHVLPYHAHVPSFGDWGYVLATPDVRPIPGQLVDGPSYSFLTDDLLPTLFTFPRDQGPREVDLNRLNDQMLVRYYEQDLVDAGMGPGPGNSTP